MRGRSWILLAACLSIEWTATRAASPADGVWTELAPPARMNHAAVYDPIRDRVLVFGGVGGGGLRGEVWALDLGGEPSWQLLVPAGQGAPARALANAIYDPVRDGMIVFGGVDGALHNDVWELSLSGAPAWHSILPAGTPPSPRSRTSMIYDPIWDRLIVFGGDDGALENDVWALNLGGSPVWQELVTVGTPPSPRSGHAAIYDPVRDRMVVFGATIDNTVAVDLWALSLGDTLRWTQIVPPGGTPSEIQPGYAAAYDPSQDLLVVDGGDYEYGGDTFSLSWSVAASGSQPWALGPGGYRTAHSLVHDPVRSRMLAYGGTAREGGGAMASVIALSPGGGWSDVLPAEPEPPQFIGSSVIFDPTPGRVVVFGGRAPTGALDAGPNGATWIGSTGANLWNGPLAFPGTYPGPLERHAAIYDEARDRMVVFGGNGGYFNQLTNQTFTLDLSDSIAWASISATGPPTPRVDAMAIDDPVRDRMLVFGGSCEFCSTALPLDSLWSLPFEGDPAWVPMVPAGTPPSPRDRALALYDPVGDRGIVFGGLGPSGPLGGLWQLALTGTPAWSALAAAGTPPPPALYAGAYDPARSCVVVCGGSDSTRVFRLSLGDSPQWTRLDIAGQPPIVASEYGLVLDRADDRFLMAGGSGTRGVWQLNLLPTVLAVADPGPRHVAMSLAPARNPTRSIELIVSMPEDGEASVDVYDLAGRLALHQGLGLRKAGPQRIQVDRSASLGPGLYFARLRAGHQSVTAKVVHLR